MATIGQPITAPESGWIRYNDNDSRILYTGAWLNNNNAGNEYGGSEHWGQDANATISFKFMGTKLRIIAQTHGWCGHNVTIKIDENTYTFSEYGDYGGQYQVLCFEKQDLSAGQHTVTITNPDSTYWNLDAIDIGNDGYLPHQFLNQVSNIDDMEVGDCIPCRYTSTTSGAVGTFSELGTCVSGDIPVTGTATPDGLFYFIKVDKGLLLCDRVVQHTISWDTLNTGKYVEGKILLIPLGSFTNPIPVMTSNITPSGVASASTITSGLDAYKAFDGATNTGWSAATSTTTGWLKYQFPTPKIIMKYTILDFGLIARNPKSWTFEGSNDGTTWIVLDTQSNATWTLGVKNEYLINNSNAYIYYRINITANNGDATYLQIGELQMLECPSGFLSYIIRSIAGGCAYAGADGNSSTTDQSKGGWPTNNEWDKYIVNSDLKGKINKGDNNIWHWSTIGTWCKETPILAINTNTVRTRRGNTVVNGTLLGSGSSNAITGSGFRPVLEYIEPDGSSKQTTLWY